MSTQPEAILEAELVAQLRGMGYGHVVIEDDDTLLANLQAQPEAFNRATCTPRDMTRILNHLQKPPPRPPDRPPLPPQHRGHAFGARHTPRLPTPFDLRAPLTTRIFR